MTVAQLQMKRDQILESLGVARAQFGERSVEYANQKEALAIVDAEMARLNANSTPSVTYAKVSQG